MIKTTLAPVLATLIFSTVLAPAAAQAQVAAVESSVPMPFADLADLATAAPMVVVVTVAKASKVDPARTGPVRDGYARAYVEADTKTLLSGPTIGAKVRYLADVRLVDGKLPRLKKQTMVLFAQPVAGRPGELQLVAPDAQVPLAQAGEARLRSLLQEIVAANSAPVVTGVRDIHHTPGNLAGEGETQIFLKTASGDPATIAVLRSPNAPVQWGLSFGELVDAGAGAPQPGTLAWYRLACTLPARLPASAQTATDPGLRQAAARDYALVMQQLGPCGRQRVF